MVSVSKRERDFDATRSRKPVCLVNLVFVFLGLLAFGRPALAQHLVFRRFDEESGLSNAAIGSLAQDQAGFLYAGTDSGLYRFDGFRFSRLGREMGLPTVDSVEAVRAAPDGRLWVVFTDRIYLVGHGVTISAALESRTDDDHAQRAAVFGDDLLLVRNHHLLRISSRADQTLSVRPYYPDAAPAREADRAILAAGIDTVQVEHGTVWAGCGLTICRLGSNNIVPFGAASGLPRDHWVALLRDHDGTFWLRSAKRIASLLPGAVRFNVVDVPGGPGRFEGDAGRLTLVEDSAGRVVTQGATGLLVHENNRWVHFDRESGTPYRTVMTMLVDREGSLWIGSNGQGAARLLGFGLFESWSHADGLSDDQIWNATRDAAGVLWAANDLTVDEVAERARAQVAVPDPQRQPDGPTPARFPKAYALARSARGWLWIGCQDGRLIRRNPWTGQSEIVARLPSIRLLSFDPKGSLWVGTEKGLARIDHPSETAVSVVTDIVPSVKRVFAITFDSAGEPWVLAERTLFHQDRQQQWHAVLQTDPQGGYQTRTMAFAPDGTLWLGSFIDGITRLRLAHGAVVGHDALLSQHLASQEVEMMHRDSAGRIWIGTDRGLDVTDGASWRHLDEQDGLAANDMNEGASFTDNDGTSWFGTSAGLSHVIDTRNLFGTVRLHPLITGISVGNHGLQPLGDVNNVVHLRWSTDPLVIGFSSLDFKFDRSILFRYRLRGVDRGWVETAARDVRYPDPPPGKLVFELVAIDPLHALRSDPIRLTIKIHAPWWRTWPAYAAGILILLGALALLSRLRVRYLLVRQRQLEALVAERTHEIEQARLILFKQANFDALTGLMNRSAILERLQAAMQDCIPGLVPLGMALLDIDHFKKINDAFGHLGGDAVLGEVGRRLSAITRESDLAGRYGGEELLLVLPGLKLDAHDRIEAVRHAVFAEPFAFEGSVIRVSCSMGVTWMRIGDDVTSMVRRADAALYRAKRDGRDRVVFDPSQPSDVPALEDRF